MRSVWLVVCAACLAYSLGGCMLEDLEFGGGGRAWLGPATFTTEEVTVAAGLAELQPTAQDDLSGSVDLSRFGITSFDRVYELETPANEDFSFVVVARGRGNFGLTRVSVGHVQEGALPPTVGIQSLAGAGLTVEAPGLSNRGDIVDINGDGFTRATLRGRISETQVLLVQVPRAGDTLNIGIRIRIGNLSEINLAGGNTQGPRPGVAWHDVYSSDSRQFGLPAIAVSGDRYSVVAYDGDRDKPDYVDRKRRWLQMDAVSGAVTGGESKSNSPDSLFWRDQEIAALGNVLAVGYTGNGEVLVEISLDRGATFPIKRVLSTSSWGTRLVQIAISSDYRLGVLYWRNRMVSSSNVSELVLQEAVATALDVNNTPVDYAWQPIRVVHTPGVDATPLLMQMEYSVGGDLVIGFGYTQVSFNMNNWTMTSTARYCLAVRLWGETAIAVSELDREVHVAPADPHVSVVGSGVNMEIFYAYEKSDGVHVLYSDDAGASFVNIASVPLPGAFMPSVYARMVGTEKRVDVLYIAPYGWGLELHNLRWTDFSPGAAPEVFQITQSSATPGGNPPPGMPPGYWITTLSWFGYDAVIMDNKLAVVTHELTYDSYEYYWALGWDWRNPTGPVAVASGGGSGGGYTQAPPPVLLPGMTDPVPPPDPIHRNQLRIAVLD